MTLRRNRIDLCFPFQSPAKPPHSVSEVSAVREIARAAFATELFSGAARWPVVVEHQCIAEPSGAAADELEV